VLQQQHAAATLASLERAHQTCCASAEYHYIEDVRLTQ
jgi:hypothetical protein